MVKKNKIFKVLRMDLPIVENLSGLQESIFSILHFGKKSGILSDFIKLFPFPLLAHVGPMAVWDPLFAYVLHNHIGAIPY